MSISRVDIRAAYFCIYNVPYILYLLVLCINLKKIKKMYNQNS